MNMNLSPESLAALQVPVRYVAMTKSRACLNPPARQSAGIVIEGRTYRRPCNEDECHPCDSLRERLHEAASAALRVRILRRIETIERELAP